MNDGFKMSSLIYREADNVDIDQEGSKLPDLI